MKTAFPLKNGLGPDFLKKLRQIDPARSILPRFSDRKTWKSFAKREPEYVRDVIRRADALLDVPVPNTDFSAYRRFGHDGNRSEYETPYLQRRKALGLLVAACCLTGKTEPYLPKIGDFLWQILGEYTWCVPAHADYADEKDLLASSEDRIDLFAAATAAVLAETLYLLRDELKAYAPILPERMDRELRFRVLESFRQKYAEKRYWWFSGFNNWSIWIAGNLLKTAGCLLQNEPETLAEIAEKTVQIADRFVARYSESGFCDEGPTYWGKAGGALILYLTYLDELVPGCLEKGISSDRRLKAIAEFPVRSLLTERYEVSFGDASSPFRTPEYTLLAAAGKLFRSELLRKYASSGTKVEEMGCGEFLTGFLFRFLHRPKTGRKTDPVLPEKVGFDNRMRILRSGVWSVSLKGGSNAESHNHNDMGHAEVFYRGIPLLIDVGTEIYRRINFSDQRYTLFYTRGAGHNAAVINGTEQAFGEAYTSEVTDRGNTLSADLSKAYPPEAGVKSYRRTLTVDGNAVILSDTISCRKKSLRTEFHFYTPQKVTLRGAEIRFGKLCTMTAPGFRVSCQELPMTDERLRSAWGKQLYHVVLSGNSPASEIRIEGKK